MINKKKQAADLKEVSFLTKQFQGIVNDTKTEIRVGISIADDKAKQEFKKRKEEAPLTTEERIFLGKL